MTKKKIEHWLDVLNYWYEHIEDYAERYPDMKTMVQEFSNVIDELYALSKTLTKD